MIPHPRQSSPDGKNFNKRRAALVLGSPRFEAADLESLTGADITETWRRAFDRHGTSAAAFVKGDFAIGLQVSDGRTFLAVDRFAIQTLCYRVDGDRLRFAERADELADADGDIDPQAIFDYLYFHVIPSPRTIYKNVFRLPPGHCATFDNGQLRVEPYWRPTFEEAPNPSFGQLKDEFRLLLQNAVATELDDGKPACFLSGGTDSSTVAGMIALASGKTASTFSIGFDAQGYDEMAFARLAARHFKTDHHEYYVTPGDLVASIPMMAASCDQPFGNSSVLPAYYCAKMAREAGVTRLLAGDGGDELYGGNSRYAKQRVFGWYQHSPKLVRDGLLEPFLGARWATFTALTRKAASYVEQARVPMPDRLQMYNLVMRLGLAEVLSPAMLEQIDTNVPLQLQRAVWHDTTNCSDLNKELAFDWRFTLAESDLPKVRSAARLAGVEVGYPMLNQGLLDFSLKLPSEYKLKHLALRWFFKEALRGFLPDEIIAKKKQGFGLPFGVWANSTPALKKLASQSLRNLAARGIVRSDFVHMLLTKLLPEHPGYFGEMVWILMMLEQWLAVKAPGYQAA